MKQLTVFEAILVGKVVDNANHRSSYIKLMKASKYIPLVLAFLIGISWFLLGEVGERDSVERHYLYYWKIGFPLVLVSFGLLGFMYRIGQLKWSLIVVMIQLLGLLLVQGSPDVLPFTLIVLVLILCSLLIAGYIGSWLSSCVNRNV